MRQKLSRILAACLVTAMIFSGNISGTALAFEGDEAGTQKEEMQTNKQENVNNEDIQEEKNTGGSDNTESKTGSEGEPALQEPEEEKQSSDDAAIDVETETQTPELQKSQETQLSVNYIYMDKLSVYSGEIQNVVLSLNQGTSQIENVVLVYSDDAGNKYQWQSEKDNSGLFLFEKTVAEETKGIYHIISINYTESGEEKEMLLSDIDMNISFGINCEYDGNNSSESLEMEPMGQEPEVSATVATIDENGILNETAELGVAEALTELGKETKSTQLRYRSAKSGNVVVVLDPGHDSGHAGAQGNGVQEEIATLKIAQYCKEELEKYSGVTVYMTRTTAACPFPETVGVGSGNILDIKKRVQWAASKGADAFVSFHLDSAGASAHGAHVYYPGDWFANNNIVSQGANLANAIQNELVGIGLYNRGTESADYSVNTESAIYGFPGLIIEHAFLTNVNDANTYLKTEAGLKKLGVADANGIVKYFGLTKGQWVQEGDKWKYKENGVFVVSDWRSINGREYYFNKSGYRVTGWENIGGKEYYFMPEGYMWTGWASFGGTKYYFMPEGYMWTGWASFGNEKYYFDAAGRMQTGWQDIDGKRYYFMPEGYMWTGWASFGGTKYYFMPEGYMWTGWASFGGAKYYFNNQGRMLTGEQTIEGEKYIFNSEGILQSNQKSGWETKEGKKYYYRNGQMQTGWQDIDGKRYYFMPEGYMWTGWASFGGTKYYFMPEGYMWTGWASFGGAKYYFDNQGRMLTGEQTIEGEKYIFNSEGILQSNQKSGWETKEGKKYYYRNGQMQTGWQDIDGKRYYFMPEGYMWTGWASFGGTKYYFMPEGYMWTGWASFGGAKYYFDNQGRMLTGEQTIEGEKYIFNSEGILQSNQKSGWETKEGKKYYYRNGQMQTGWQDIDGKRYYFMPEGYMWTGWASFGGTKYYFMPEGYMWTGWASFGGAKYYFDNQGRMLTGEQTIEGEKYIFNSEGILQSNQKSGWETKEGKKYYYRNGQMQTGWQDIDGKRYYFMPEGYMWTGWASFGGTKYYFMPEGYMWIGWASFGGERYYFDGNGRMIEGVYTVEGIQYQFNSKGILIGECSKYYMIEGATETTINQMINYYQSSGHRYPAEVLKKGGAETLEKFCTIFYNEALKENIKAEVAFVQTMKETGWLQFGGDVKIEQFNFAGLGATGNGVSGNSFKDVETGVRAQIQHLKAYGSVLPLNQICVDQRFEYVKRGSAIYVEWLGIPDNPDGKGWASAEGYGFDLHKMIDKLLACGR